jgi:hypothetical protein
VKTIIAGGRDYQLTNWDRGLLEVLPITEVVSGGARGADAGGEQWAASRGLPVTRFPADWNSHGRRAGYLRNVQMAEYIGGGGCVVLFHGGRGTDMMYKIAVSRGLLVFDFRGQPT